LSVEFKLAAPQNDITESYGFKKCIAGLSNQKAGLSLAIVL
jgi:hypothetical protein